MRIGAAILVAAAIILVWDWWQANREMDRLLDAFELSETAMVEGQAHVYDRYEHSAWANFDPEAGPFEPGYVDPARREQAFQEASAAVSDAASTAMADVRTAGAEIEQVTLMPWHRSLGEARDAYLDHNEAWVKYLRAVATDAGKLGDNVLGDDIAATFRIAERRAEDALPILPIRDARQRVEETFADEG